MTHLSLSEMNEKKQSFQELRKNLAAKSSPKVSFFVPFWIFGAPAASTNHLAIRGLMYDLTHGAWEPWSFLQAKILFKKQGTTRWWPRFMVKLHETCSSFPMPKCGSMGLVIFTYHGKWLIFMGSVGKCTSPMDPMGILMFWCQLNINSIILVTYVYIIISSLRSAFLLESRFSENEWGIPQIVGKGKKKQPNTSFWEKKVADHQMGSRVNTDKGIKVKVGLPKTSRENTQLYAIPSCRLVYC